MVVDAGPRVLELLVADPATDRLVHPTSGFVFRLRGFQGLGLVFRGLTLVQSHQVKF